MPALGFGTAQIFDVEPILSAIKVGYRHIDTASYYKNEEVVGQAIRQAIDQGICKREDLFIVTKIWHSEYDDPEAALERSLTKLGLNYIDLYLVHWPTACSHKKVPLHVLWPKLESFVYR